jgi:hypothetical protein
MKDCRGDAEDAEKGKRFNTECTEENRRTQRKITAYCEFKVNGARLKAAATNSEATAKQQQRLPGSMKLNRPLPFDPAQRDLRMNRPVGRFTNSNTRCEGRTTIRRNADFLAG